MNEQIKAIRNEIERLYGEYKDKFKQYGDQYHLGLIDGLDMAERVLDTLSEAPDNSLEEAAEEYAKQYTKETKSKDADGEIWRVGDVMIENQMSFEDGFKAGAQWMAGQGVILNLSIDEFSCGAYNACVEQGLTSEDDVIVQIRKA